VILQCTYGQRKGKKEIQACTNVRKRKGKKEIQACTNVRKRKRDTSKQNSYAYERQIQQSEE
jgi:hypothetical protein